MPTSCYRADTLCLTVTSIGGGAGYSVAEGTTGRLFLRRYKATSLVVVAASVRPNDGTATSLTIATTLMP